MMFAPFGALALLAPVIAGASGVSLADMTWVDAKARLNGDTVVVIPLGAQSKEHGPHLPLDTDYVQAMALTKRVLAASDVVVAPALNYSAYPAFVEYAGSTNLGDNVARDVIVDVVRSLAHHGPRRFYVINIGVSTNTPLGQAKALLAVDGIALEYLDLTSEAVDAVDKSVRTQPEGTHADEIETSIMLALDPKRVDMKKAVTDFGAGKGRGPFTPDPNGARPSPSGIYGDATKATAAKGKIVLDGYTRVILDSIDQLRRSPPPDPVNLYGKLIPKVRAPILPSTTPPPATPDP